MATRPEPKLTYEDYVRFPDDGRRWELIDGEAFVTPSPTTNHQHIVLELARQVKSHLLEHGGGHVFVAPLDVVLAPGDVVQPDVLFVSDDDAEVITERNIQGPPTWVVEVVSDPVRDKKVKRDLYARYEVPEYWTIDPDLRTAEVHRPCEPTVVYDEAQHPSPAALPGLRIDLAVLFGPPGPRRI